MAKVQVLGQRCPHGDKMLIRGVFTQRKKLWEAMEKALKTCKLEDLTIAEDISDKTYPASYKNLCNQLRLVGRASLVDADGSRVFQVVDAETNVIRGWDVDAEGPRCNPLAK
jgi:hypothetical protein